MSVIRAHVSTFPDELLLELWSDYDAYNDVGHIAQGSELAGLRDYIAGGGLTRGFEVATPILWIYDCMAEVYRLCALRGIRPDGAAS